MSDLIHESWIQQELGELYGKHVAAEIDGMRVVKDASEDCVQAIKIAPGALVDLSTDPSQPNHQADMSILESKFSYDGRAEHHLNRTKNDMYELLSVPNVSLEQLKGLAQSGKGIDGIYRELVARCEEKWAEGWDDALRWMVDTLILMARQYNVAKLPRIICIEYTEITAFRWKCKANIAKYLVRNCQKSCPLTASPGTRPTKSAAM